MPKAALRPCRYPGCPELVIEGYCDDHKPFPQKRQSDYQRLYDRRWQKRREQWLTHHPWCEECLQQGFYIPATEVHHLVPHRGNIEIFLNSPLESLCKSCHSRKTLEEIKGRGAEKVLNGRVSSAGGHPREKKSQREES
ncbi:HNH endonuclease [Bellilinea caldifistulae]|uniref:HNH domain-containing protein n=1 Tax=Bellilinea caldifistulae TaxID=360411 RepID=A0A0P6X3X5_9CHLR|nr:hypothetical protein AC812_12175 [Bellilinea caldifistulae]GAP11756.1 HNH endonuclease [Bellilinea caldifistulae]